jgi:hypothetical protein
MLNTAVYVCFVGALLLFVYALLRARGDRTGPAERIAVLVLATLLLILGTAAAAIEEKVAGKGHQAEVKPSSPDAITKGDLEAFRPGTKIYSGPAKDLCFAQYYDGSRPLGQARSMKWWTSCTEAKAFRTIEQVRKELALPSAWGPRSRRVFARVPENVTVTYIRGRAARQCAGVPRECREGGGLQFRVLGMQERWLQRPHCPEPAREDVSVRWTRCSD